MFFDLFKIIKIITLILLNKKVIIYTVRSRFGSVATGLALFETYLESKNFDYIILINFNKNKIFNRYITLRGYDTFNSIRVPYTFLRILTLVNLDRKIAPFHKNFHTNDEGEVSSKFPYLKFNEYVETKESSKIDDFIKSNFIVFSVKEEGFYDKSSKTWGKFNYKNFKQPVYEFDSFSRLIPSVTIAISKGYNVIRVGRNLKKVDFKHPSFFDYASSEFTSDENDFIIAKHCKFVLTNGTGFDALAALWFKKPIYYYNLRNYRYMHTHFPYRMFNPILCLNKNRKINFKKVLETESKYWNKGLYTKSHNQHANHKLMEFGYKYIYYDSDVISNSVIKFINDYEGLNLNNIEKIYLQNSDLDFWRSFNKVYNKKLNNEGRSFDIKKIFIRPNEDLL